MYNVVVVSMQPTTRWCHFHANDCFCLPYSLGARHDETDNTCKEDDMYIMTPTIKALTQQNLANAFTFSSCSIAYFKNTLSGESDK